MPGAALLFWRSNRFKLQADQHCKNCNMSKRLFSIIASLITIGMGFVIAGVVAPCMVKACLREKPHFPPPRPPPGFGPFTRRERIEKDVVKTEDGKEVMCMQQGLFFVGIQEKEDTTYIVTPLEKRSKQIRVVAGLLLIGGVGAFFAEIIFIIGACHSVERDPKTNQITMKRGIVGTVILAISFVLLLSGLSMYTSLKVRAITSGTEFLLDAGSALAGIDRDQAEDFLAPNLPPGFESGIISFTTATPLNITDAPPPTDEYSNKNISELLDLLPPDIGNLLATNVGSPWFPTPLGENDILVSIGQPVGRVKRSPRKIRNFPGMMKLFRFVMSRSSLRPTFGYAFYLSWIGMAALFVGLVCGTYYRIRQGYIARMALSNV